ncbi:hypothetical protein MPSEU_000808200 [Mayamaea pseudoterrestris]|nr:hypothetical protein MPSEU_000808200 [Mayamaea pseudoterrestris]
MTSNIAPIKWAQRSDSIYLTIALPDVTNETINLTEDALKFQGTSGGKEYTVDIEFFKPISTSAADSKYAVHPRNVQFLLIKKETDEEFWPRLLKDKTLEKNQVAVDWDRYVDEDEQDEGFDTSALAGGQGLGGMGGMGGMPGMGGMGGMGGMDMEALMKQMGGMGGGGMGGMPDMGDMGNMDFGAEGDDEDDDGDDDGDELPDLEEVN